MGDSGNWHRGLLHAVMALSPEIPYLYLSPCCLLECLLMPGCQSWKALLHSTLTNEEHKHIRSGRARISKGLSKLSLQIRSCCTIKLHHFRPTVHGRASSSVMLHVLQCCCFYVECLHFLCHIKGMSRYSMRFTLFIIQWLWLRRWWVVH